MVTFLMKGRYFFKTFEFGTLEEKEKKNQFWGHLGWHSNFALCGP